MYLIKYEIAYTHTYFFQRMKEHRKKSRLILRLTIVLVKYLNNVECQHSRFYLELYSFLLRQS